MSFARWSASIRCWRDRSGAETVVLVAGGMGGESTSMRSLGNPSDVNSARPQVEVQHCGGELMPSRVFAGFFGRFVLCGSRARDRRGGVRGEGCELLRDARAGERIAERFGADSDERGTR